MDCVNPPEETPEKNDIGIFFFLSFLFSLFVETTTKQLGKKLYG